MATTTEFRTCPDTGLLFHKPAEKLMQLNAVAGIVFLTIGGVLGLLIGLTRWPSVHLLQADSFYMLLTAHGVSVLIFWIIFFEIAVLYFTSSTLLRSRLATPRWAWWNMHASIIQNSQPCATRQMLPCSAHSLLLRCRTRCCVQS